MTRDSRYTPSLSEVDIGPEAEWLESLASLADGGLDAKRRNEILAQLDGDPEAMDLLAEVMALEAEVAEVSFPPDSAVTPDDGLRDNVIQGPWRKRAWAVATAIAAVLALVIVAPRLLSPLPPTPQSTVGALNVENLDGATLKNFPWSPDRGGGGGIGLSEDKLSSRDSFRLGVLRPRRAEEARVLGRPSPRGFEFELRLFGTAG